ncbi:MAG: hypothetical protein NC452_05760 [Eubacterium sp.]|nr:hypothetical protein [Eubacterium sp.]
MRTFTKPLAALCCFAMLCASLCACSGETEKTVPESTSKIETKVQRESSNPEFAESELSVSFGAANSDDAAYSEESGVTVTGKPLSSEQLTEFNFERSWAESVMKNGYAGAFLDTLDNAEFKDLYCTALSLVHSMSNIIPTDAVPTEFADKAQLTVDGQYGFYLESGYTYESFQNAFYSAFTKETADTIFSRYPFFQSYNGELWYKDIGVGGNVGEIYQEYVLINQTDTELEFKRISYSVAIGEPLTDYDPAKKDEYEKSEVEFLFVKTADGWRAEKFLNATDYGKTLLPS